MRQSGDLRRSSGCTVGRGTVGGSTGNSVGDSCWIYHSCLCLGVRGMTKTIIRTRTIDLGENDIQNTVAAKFPVR